MVFVGFRIPPALPDHGRTAQSKEASEEKLQMHDLLIALAFIGIVVAPAIVAARTDISDGTE